LFSETAYPGRWNLTRHPADGGPLRGGTRPHGETSPSLDMERIEAGRAHCVLCGEAIRPNDEAFVTPDFLADETDPFWRFSDAPMHHSCFLLWDRRKSFVAHYNRIARRWVAADGSHPHMTSEGEIVWM
jgi:hypothetical protein